MGSDSQRLAGAVPDLGRPPRRVPIDARIVSGLVSEQFPQWSHLSVEPVRDPGWDNYTFRLGDEMLVRLPSAAAYALAVEKEQRWLPRLAPHLSVPIPSVCGRGVPGAGYAFPWSVYRWLEGVAASSGAISDLVVVAQQLADFLVTLRRVDASDGPRPGLHSWYRGGPLQTYDADVRRALAALDDRVDVELVEEMWSVALAAAWRGEDAWFHGDLAAGNLLLQEGRLAAVIDFGTCGVGDPACDLAVAWTLLTEPSRALFKDRLDVDEASWARGRGWALWKTLVGLAAEGGDDSREAARLWRVLDELSAEYVGLGVGEGAG